ncbi:MAG: ABC transporter permease, partial [Pseudomonadota bacterium]
AKVSVGGESFAAVAAGFLREAGLSTATTSPRDNPWQRLRHNVLVHLQLTGMALALACVAGIALSLAVYRSERLSRIVLYFSGLLQTIPSIALLALMIPLFGVGRLPAVVALFLYSLLPIVRSTVTALITIDPVLRDVARAMGLSPREQVRHVLLPLALPNLLTGVKTAAIISIGTATLAAFIGAGGLGEPIVTGLALNDVGLILHGAIPAALLAIVTEFAFELLERRLLPAHMVAR